MDPQKGTPHFRKLRFRRLETLETPRMRPGRRKRGVSRFEGSGVLTIAQGPSGFAGFMSSRISWALNPYNKDPTI